MKNKLEKQGIRIGPLGLGIEHFAKRGKTDLVRKENTIKILETALKLGITHYDLVFNLPYFLDIFGEVIANIRDEITFSAHLGTIYNAKTIKIQRTRSIQPIKVTFEDLLKRINTDYVDIAMIQFIKSKDDYYKIIENGFLDYVLDLKKQGKAKAIGISGHDYQLLIDFIDKAPVDVVMTIMNFATGAFPALKQLITKCKDRNIAVIGIKTLLKGKVFSSRKEFYAGYYSGGSKFNLKLHQPATAKQCFNYAHSLGADSVVFGVKTAEELLENVNSFNSVDELQKFGIIIEQFQSITR